VYPSADTTGWFRERNLAGQHSHSTEPPIEAVVYALVTLAVHPSKLPPKAAEYLAQRFLAHCVGDGPPN